MALPKGEGGLSKNNMFTGASGDQIVTEINILRKGVVSSIGNLKGSLDRLVDLMRNLVQIQEGILDEAAKARLEKFREIEQKREAARADQEEATTTGAVQDNKLPNWALILAGITAFLIGYFDGLVEAIKALFKLSRLDKAFTAIRTLFTSNGAIGRLFNSFRTRWLSFVDDFVRILDERFPKLSTVLTRVSTFFTNTTNKFIIFFDDFARFVDRGLDGIKLFFSAEGGMGRFLTGLRTTFSSAFTGAAAIVDDLIQPFKAIFGAEGSVGKAISRLFNGIVDIFKFPFVGFIDEVATPFKQLTSTDDAGLIKRIFDSVTKPFRAGLTFVENLVKPLVTFFSAEGPIAKFVGVIRSAFAGISEGTPLMKLLGGIGSVLGKLFLPLTLIITAYDTVKGFLKGFEEGGWIEGVEGGIVGLINSVVGAPLDLVKSVVAYILEKFGFKNAAKALRSFSFMDLITSGVDAVFDMFKGIVNALIESIAILVDKVPGLGKLADKLRSMKFDVNERERNALLAEVDELEDQEKVAKRLRKRAQDRLRMLERSNTKFYDAEGNEIELSKEERAARVDEAKRTLDRLELREASLALESQKKTLEAARLEPDIQKKEKQALDDQIQELARAQEELDQQKAELAKESGSTNQMNQTNISTSSASANYAVQGRPTARVKASEYQGYRYAAAN